MAALIVNFYLLSQFSCSKYRYFELLLIVRCNLDMALFVSSLRGYKLSSVANKQTFRAVQATTRATREAPPPLHRRHTVTILAWRARAFYVTAGRGVDGRACPE